MIAFAIERGDVGVGRVDAGRFVGPYAAQVVDQVGAVVGQCLVAGGQLRALRCNEALSAEVVEVAFLRSAQISILEASKG
ncbi:hypothetical protein D3C72_2324800 [compost metagenome]